MDGYSLVSSLGLSYCKDCRKRFDCIVLFGFRGLDNPNINDGPIFFNLDPIKTNVAQRSVKSRKGLSWRKPYQCIRAIPGNKNDLYDALINKVKRLFTEQIKQIEGL